MIKLAYDHPNYRHRLMLQALYIVDDQATPESVRKAIEERRQHEGDVVANDLRNLCRDRWQRIGR